MSNRRAMDHRQPAWVDLPRRAANIQKPSSPQPREGETAYTSRSPSGSQTPESPRSRAPGLLVFRGSDKRCPPTGKRMGARIDSTRTVSLRTGIPSLKARHACTRLSPRIPDRPNVPDHVSVDRTALPAEPSEPCRTNRDHENPPTSAALTRSIPGTIRSDVHVARGGTRPPGSTRGGPLTATSEQPASTTEDMAGAQNRFSMGSSRRRQHRG